MKKVYPVILTPDTGGYVVTIPDLDINTQGEDLADALYMAKDAIGSWGICRLDLGKSIPEPSKSEPPHQKDELISWVDIDFDKYRDEWEENAEENELNDLKVNINIRSLYHQL